MAPIRDVTFKTSILPLIFNLTALRAPVGPVACLACCVIGACFPCLRLLLVVDGIDLTFPVAEALPFPALLQAWMGRGSRHLRQ